MLTAHGVTHPGRVRKNNEDALFWDAGLGLCVVADGMGGHNAGEVASQLAIEAIKGFLDRSRNAEDFTWPYGLDPSMSFQSNRLMTAIKLANRRVFKAGESRDDYTGLGTTVVVALVSDGRLTFCGIGDSRLYLYANGALEQVTQDDTWTATILGRGLGHDVKKFTAHPLRHVLTNVLGARAQIEMQVGERALDGDATLLLCSDGLHNALDDAALAEVLAGRAPAEEQAEALVQLALEREATDNITALVARVSTNGSAAKH
jgi:protein phosphatase